MNKHTVTGLAWLAMAVFFTPVIATPSATPAPATSYFSQVVSGIANGASSFSSADPASFDKFIFEFNFSPNGLIDANSGQINLGPVSPVSGSDAFIRFEQVPNFADFTWPYNQVDVGVADLNSASSFTGGIAVGSTYDTTMTLADSSEPSFEPKAFSLELNTPGNVFTFFGSAGSEPLHFQDDPNHWRIFADTSWGPPTSPALWILLFDAEGANGANGYNDGIFVLGGYTVHPVPEPALIGLLALPGVLFFAFFRRRRRAAR